MTAATWSNQRPASRSRLEGTCPCTIWTRSQTPAGDPAPDPNAVEVGTRFRTDQGGYITAIRFYKNSQNVGPHSGNLWTSGGAQLGTVAFTGETASGWQEATLPTPVAVAANTTYVVSYHTSGFYAATNNYFAVNGVDNGPLHALRDGQDGPNGVYRYGAGGFPTQTFQSANYWVDVVFVTSIGPDTTPPTVSSVIPTSGASGVALSTSVSAAFSESMSAATIGAATFELRDPSNALVPSAVSYAAGVRTATLAPNGVLSYDTTYTARVIGGAGGVTDTAGNPLATNFVWSFTTGPPPPPPPTEGPGGPILVIGSTANPFSRYYAEILRTEGLNAFTAMDITQVNASVLAGYDVAILGEMPLTGSQVTLLTNWVNAGGNLIAMRPDKQLAGLLGLTDAATTLPEGYLLVNTSAAPGAGIVGQTMQYHGTADRYTLNGASEVATLYSNATTATPNPAVTVRSLGGSGGQAAAFTYDLARSIVFTRQGNPAWSGQERDGVAPIRSDDLFFGGAQTDWVDLNHVAIPQADEQQRLLANLISHMNANRKPLPRFWYFPRGEKAVVVMTGDDHANNGTAGRFDIYRSNSPASCSVNDWECVRATSYIYPNTPISDAQAASYVADGFEIAVHITTGCADYTAASLPSNYTGDLAQFASLFPSLPAPRTNRTHCISWSDFDTQPQVSLAHGIRLDTNYYYWPQSWILDRPGFMTGSGMPMRFARTDGTIVDVYQAATQMTDESGQSWPFTIDTLLDRALGPEGYYGFFVANMHTDFVQHVGSEAIVASALARSVPVISAQQLLTWLDGRNTSSFGSLAWNGSSLTFTVTVGTGASGIEAMLPMASGAATVVSLTRGGVPVSFRVETVKGVAYAMFSAQPGAYQADYGVDTTAPIISGVSATPAASSATVAWTTNEPATSRVDYGLAPAALNQVATSGAGLTTTHAVGLSGLASGTTYYYAVTSADAAGNPSSAPPTPASFTTTTPPSFNCPCTIWPATATPTVTSQDDSAAVELGVKFRASTDGFITGIRFYKGVENTGVHVGNLWTTNGSLLGSATFTNEPASGWQEVGFDTPVAVTANTTYVASYHAPNGRYAADGGAFASAGVVNGPLEALANGVAAGNGVYRYGASGFPSGTFNSTNYWVDVVFATSVGAPRSLAISDVSVIEGDSGTLSALVTVTLSSASAQTVTVNYATANGTAVAPGDYTVTSGTLSFHPGETSAQISVAVLGDSLDETNELVLVNLSASTNATIADAQGVVTITDNDPAPSLTIGDVTVTEGNSGTLNAVFAVALSAISGQTVTVDYTTASGTAASPGDFTAASGTITFNPGAISAQVTVAVAGDTLDEANETFVVNLSAAANATIADSQGVGTINDNDATPSMVINNVTVTEGNTGTVNASFTVTLSAASGQTVTVNYATTDATAVAPGDYTSATGTLTFAPGNRTQPIVVSVAPDTLDEPNETYVVDLSGATNATIADTQGTGTINDNDPTPSLRINNVTVPEGSSGTVTATFTVTLSAASSRTVTVNYTTADNTAVAPGDYTTTSGSLTFLPGTTTQQVPVLVVGDTLDETNETYRVNLSGATNASIADSQGVGTITDNDPLPSLVINNVSVTEGAGGTTTATFTVTLSAASGRSVSVNFATANGTGTAGIDYVARSGTLTFSPGVTTQTIAITVNGDATPEPNETFVVNLSGAVNATIADNQGVGTIVNDD